MSQLEVDKIIPQSGTTLTIGDSGDTISLPSGVSLDTLTITGDLTVDTDTLYVDSTNNRVGIGTSSPSSALDVDGIVTATQFVGGGINAFRNLIINGAMVIDQRNGGSTVTAHNSYPVDRFRISEVTTTGTFEASRSTEAPDDFTNSLLFKVKTTDTSIGAEYAGIRTKIEGYNISHLNFGTSAAKTITLSFYVKFSVTGTYGGAIGNGSDRTYPFSYTVNTADTWERKTITIEGSTSGTFASDNAVGFEIWLLSIGGTNFGNEAAGAWVDSYEISPTGVTNFYATDESTYYITGVQLEVGDTATPFEHLPYDVNLQRCQRYFYREVDDDSLMFTWVGFVDSSTTAYLQHPHPVEMRAEPSMSTTGTAGDYSIRIGGNTIGCSSVPSLSSGNRRVAHVAWSVSSGLTTGQAVVGKFDAADKYIDWSAEL